MEQYIERAISYNEYLSYFDDTINATGRMGISDDKLSFIKLNAHRMRRIEKTIAVDENVLRDIRSLNVDWVWLILTEAWCGDSAQNIPVIEKLAAVNKGIQTRYIFRDENPKLMERFLTNGARSIPKLIVFDLRTGQVLGVWGPRPVKAQEYFEKLKADGLDKPVIMEQLQRWYLDDGGSSLQRELQHLVAIWSRPAFSAAA